MRQAMGTDPLFSAERYFRTVPQILEPDLTITSREMATGAVGSPLHRWASGSRRRTVSRPFCRTAASIWSSTLPYRGWALHLSCLTFDLRRQSCAPSSKAVSESSDHPGGHGGNSVNPQWHRSPRARHRHPDYASLAPVDLGQGCRRERLGVHLQHRRHHCNPKSVMLSLRNLFSCASRIQRLLNFTKDDVCAPHRSAGSWFH